MNNLYIGHARTMSITSRLTSCFAFTLIIAFLLFIGGMLIIDAIIITEYYQTTQYKKYTCYYKFRAINITPAGLFGGHIGHLHLECVDKHDVGQQLYLRYPPQSHFVSETKTGISHWANHTLRYMPVTYFTNDNRHMVINGITGTLRSIDVYIFIFVFIGSLSLCLCCIAARKPSVNDGIIHQ